MEHLQQTISARSLRDTNERERNFQKARELIYVGSVLMYEIPNDGDYRVTKTSKQFIKRRRQEDWKVFSKRVAKHIVDNYKTNEILVSIRKYGA